MNEYYTIWIDDKWAGEDFTTLEAAKDALPSILVEFGYSKIGDKVSVVIAKCQDVCVGGVSISIDAVWDGEDTENSN